MPFVDRFDKTFIDTVVNILKLCYMWSPKNENEKLTYYAVVIVFSFIIVPLLIILQIIFMVQNISDVDKLVPTLAQCILQTLYFYKQCIWYYHMRKIQTCVDILERKSFNFDDYDDDYIDFEGAYCLMRSLTNDFCIDDCQSDVHTAKLEKFWMNNRDTIIINHAQNKRRNLKPMKIMYKELTREGNIYCTLFYYGIWIFVFFILFLMCQDCVVQSTKELYLGKVISNHRLPVNIYLPNHIDNNIIFYAFIAYFVSTAITILSVQLIAEQLFFTTILARISWQLKVIQYAIESIETVQDVSYICKMDFQFYKCTHELQQLMILLENLKDIYGMPLLFQYIFLIIVNISILFSIPQVDSPLVILGLLAFVSGSTSNLFFTFLFITIVTTEFAEAQNSFYFINWPGTNIKFQKKVLYAILRMQKSIGIKMGEMIEAKLELFIKAMQTSYTVLTLLYTTKTNEN